MNVFWKSKPLAAPQAKLLTAILQAHEQCAMRDNISTVTLRNAAVGSGSFTNAVAAALLTTGATHAPLLAAFQFLATFNPDELEGFARHVELGGLVPGWGSDFVKGSPDDALKEVAACLAEHYPALNERIARVTDELHARSKLVYPNLACYTAASAIALELPPLILPWLLIQGRLAQWAREFVNTIAVHNAPRRKDLSEPSHLVS